MGLLVLLIIPSFVLFGLEGYTQLNEQTEEVARVAGQKITKAQWDELHSRESDRVRAQVPGLDPALLDSDQARYATLERLVRDRVLAEAAQKNLLLVSDARLARELQANEVIAGLRGPDGKLDLERYRQLLGSQGMTPEMFEASVRSDLAASQVLQGVAATALLANAQADSVLQRFFEQREVQVALFRPADFAAQVKLTDADIETYYQANAARFQTPEQADIEYLVLSVEALREGISPTEQEIASYYEQNAALLSAKEERRASHILITAPSSASADERSKARARAQALLSEVRRAPDTFAEVARKNSQDPGSAANGGDLGFFARGAMVKPFEDVAFSQAPGAISDVVETEFGFHIIRLTEIQAPKQPSLAELRGKIVADLREQQAQAKYAEAAESFTNGVYEQSDSLEPTAQKLKLPVQRASNVGRSPAPGATGPLANARFLQALFGTDALELKRNTEALEIGPSQLASGRVVQHRPARTLPLADVRAQVVASLTAERASDMARAQGQAKLKAWQEAPASAQFPAAIRVSRDDPQGQPQALVVAALRADPDKLPALIGVDLQGLGFAVVRVIQLGTREPPLEEVRRRDREQLTRWWADAESNAYYETLKSRFKVNMKVPDPTPR